MSAKVDITIRPNILITSAAAKVLLVKAFAKAAEPYGGHVFTADVASHCAAGFFSRTHFQVLPINNKGSLPELLSLCKKNNIGLIVPTRDGEINFFAKSKTYFEEAGITVLVPSQKKLSDILNKQNFSDAVEAKGMLAVPRISVLEAKKSLPIFVRPISGAGGIGARAVSTLEELELINSKEYLFHPLLKAPEYSADLLMSLSGEKAIGAVCRERISVVAGESKSSKVRRNPRAEAQVCKLGEELGMVGHNTIQFFDHSELGILFIEVNPRFGGASNLSIQAGLESPKRILAMMAKDSSAFDPVQIQD